MAAQDNMQPRQFPGNGGNGDKPIGPEAYKQERMAILYERSLRSAPIQSVVNPQKGGE